MELETEAVTAPATFQDQERFYGRRPHQNGSSGKLDAKKFYLQHIPKFDQLETISGKDRATGAAAETAKEKKHQWRKECSERNLA